MDVTEIGGRSPASEAGFYTEKRAVRCHLARLVICVIVPVLYRSGDVQVSSLLDYVSIQKKAMSLEPSMHLFLYFYHKNFTQSILNPTF